MLFIQYISNGRRTLSLRNVCLQVTYVFRARADNMHNNIIIIINVAGDDDFVHDKSAMRVLLAFGDISVTCLTNRRRSA